MSAKNQPNQEEQIWGPLSLRDLDVLLRTNQINSKTLGWTAGMSEWKVLNEIDQIKQSILESSKQIIEISKKRQSLFDKGSKKPQTSQNPTQKDAQLPEDVTIENKDQNPLTILQSTVQNLLKQSFHQSQDGKWNIYDEEKQQWLKQDEQPIQQIQIMKKNLFNKLKNELFFVDGKNNRRKNIKKKEEQVLEENLTEEQLLKRQRNKKKTKRAASKKKQKWYKSKINTFIYISGLPYDITEEQLKEFASRAGVLRVDLETGKPKIKIYKDQQGFPKGDAAISFVRQQSVQIAIDNLNNSQIRSGFVVKVQRAQFMQKDIQYKPRQTKKQAKINKIITKKNQKKMFTWNEEVENEGEGLRIVIIKHVFTPQLVQDQQYIDSVKKEITFELGKIGQIQRIRFYQAHIEGVVEVKFKNDKDAQQCIHLMNGRFYDGRQLVCEYWDGQTDYKRSGVIDYQRMNQFGKQLQKLQNIAQESGEQGSVKDQNIKQYSQQEVEQKVQEPSIPVPKQNNSQ